VRVLYDKHWKDEDLRSTVADLKAAGLGVSVLTLVGAGGVDRAEPHVERTARLIEALDLRGGDFVFLLEEREIRETGQVPSGFNAIDGSAWAGQQRRFREALAPLKDRGIKVLPYTLEKQWK